MNNTSGSTISLSTSQPKEKMKASDILNQQIGAGDEAEKKLGDFEDTPAISNFSTEGFQTMDQLFGTKTEQPQPTKLELDNYQSYDPTPADNTPKSTFTAEGDHTLAIFNKLEVYKAKQIVAEMQSQQESTYLPEKGQAETINSRPLDLQADAPTIIDSATMPKAEAKVDVLAAADSILSAGKAWMDKIKVKQSFEMVFGDLFGKQILGLGQEKTPTEKDIKKKNNQQISINAQMEEKARVDSQTQMKIAREEVRIADGPIADEEYKAANNTLSADVEKTVETIHNVANKRIADIEAAKKDKAGPIEAPGRAAAGGIGNNKLNTDSENRNLSGNAG